MKRLLLLLLIIAGFLFYFSLGTKVTANLDHFIYELPFMNGSRYKVVQGYGGRFSHKNKAALDFRMPEGTPIYAARGGKVYSYKEDSDEGGPLPGYNKKANYIIIQHSDGSFGCYWHLRKGGVVTKRGRVRQ